MDSAKDAYHKRRYDLLQQENEAHREYIEQLEKEKQDLVVKLKKAQKQAAAQAAASASAASISHASSSKPSSGGGGGSSSHPVHPLKHFRQFRDIIAAAVEGLPAIQEISLKMKDGLPLPQLDNEAEEEGDAAADDEDGKASAEASSDDGDGGGSSSSDGEGEGEGDEEDDGGSRGSRQQRAGSVGRGRAVVKIDGSTSSNSGGKQQEIGAGGLDKRGNIREWYCLDENARDFFSEHVPSADDDRAARRDFQVCLVRALARLLGPAQGYACYKHDKVQAVFESARLLAQGGCIEAYAQIIDGGRRTRRAASAATTDGASAATGSKKSKAPRADAEGGGAGGGGREKRKSSDLAGLAKRVKPEPT